MEYEALAKECEGLCYRDKLRLSQLLIQLARKEEEIQNPQNRGNLKPSSKSVNTDEPTSDINSIAYVADRSLEVKPAKKKSLIISRKAMYQFKGGVSDADVEKVISKLEELKHIKVESNNRVTYL